MDGHRLKRQACTTKPNEIMNGSILAPAPVGLKVQAAEENTEVLPQLLKTRPILSFW